MGDALPPSLINYLAAALKAAPGTLAIHMASSIESYKTNTDQDAISRTKGFIGTPQLERPAFPNAVHHVKIFHNGKGKARVFYKDASQFEGLTDQPPRLRRGRRGR